MCFVNLNQNNEIKLLKLEIYMIFLALSLNIYLSFQVYKKILITSVKSLGFQTSKFKIY